MVNITLSIPNDTKNKMNDFPEINWSGFVKKCVEEKMKQLTKLEEMKKQLESDEEEGVIDWSVKLQRAGRSGRLDELKKKGLI